MQLHFLNFVLRADDAKAADSVYQYVRLLVIRASFLEEPAPYVMIPFVCTTFLAVLMAASAALFIKPYTSTMVTVGIMHLGNSRDHTSW